MVGEHLAEFGLRVGDLPSNSYSDKPYPKRVAGRVAHIDADFLAYQVSAESKDELDPTNDKPRKSFEDMCHNATMAAEHLKSMCGADSYVCHLTPSGSNKGGRDDQAMQKPYQGNRKDREKPEFLDAMRKWIANNLNGIEHVHQEADDGLAQALYNAEDKNLAVLASKDKDLRMVPGLHLDISRGIIVEVDTWGYLEVDESKSAKKVVGYGSKFFWAQVLMGDTADNIQGLPECVGRATLSVKPTAAYTKAVEALKKLSLIHI